MPLLFYDLPCEVLNKIYEYDDTYKIIFKTKVLHNEGLYDFMSFQKKLLDKGYTIRNFMEDKPIIPRYIDDGKVYGSYIRRRWRCTDPL